MEKTNYPCPCGGKLEWKRQRVIEDGIDCGILDIEHCKKCSEIYLPDESLAIVENKLKEHGLWGTRRKEIKFWKSGNAIVIRLPTELSKDLQNVKRGYLYKENDHKIAIDF